MAEHAEGAASRGEVRDSFSSDSRPGISSGGINRVLGKLALTSFQRLAYTKTAVVLGFAAGFLLSHRLWISSRYYPLIPIFHNLPQISFPLDYIFAGVMFLLLWLIAFAAKPRAYIFGFAALLIFLALFDQTRWQPWVYLYLFLLLSLGCFSWNAADVEKEENVLNICRLVIGATYFYSGLQKINPHFAAIGMVSLLGPWAARLPLLHVWPFLLAGIEVAIALGLLTRRYRNLAVLCGIGMHCFILFSQIAIFHWNSIIWPWNVVMIALLVILFWQAHPTFADIVWRNPIAFQKVVLVLFAIMPVFSFFGLWDSYLSASLYSGNIAQANILMRGDVKGHLPSSIRRYVKQLPAGTGELTIRDWALGELDVPPYPAMRAYRIIGAQICKYANNSPDVMLVMLDRDTLLGKAEETRDTCLGTLLVKKW